MPVLSDEPGEVLPPLLLRRWNARFRPDERKSGGVYETVSGIVKQIDLIARRIRLLDETDIPMDDVLTLDGALFDVLD